MVDPMKCEYLQDADGVVRLTAVFESREDMDKFREVYDEFAALLPIKTPDNPSLQEADDAG
jgi:hypothetical protein